MMNNKARMTIRFDQPNKANKGSSTPKGWNKAESGQIEEQQHVIPLRPEDYLVVKEEREVEESTPASRPVPESIRDTGMLNPYTNDYGAWSAPIEDEAARVERIIRQSDEVLDAAPERPLPPRQEVQREGTQQSYQWYREAEASSYSRLTRGRSGSPFPWGKAAMSVSAAVITGFMIGTFALQLFYGQNGAGGGLQWLPDAAKTPAAAVPADSGAVPKPNSAAAAAQAAPAVAVGLQATTYYMLQHGAFGGKEGAGNAAAELRRNGLGAAISEQDRMYVYAGLTKDKADATVLAQTIQKSKLDVYVKPVQLPEIKAMRWNGKQPEALKAYWTQSQTLTDMIVNVTTVLLHSETAGKIEEGSLQRLKNAYQSWNGTVAAAAEGFGGKEQEKLQAMNNALHTAVRSIEEYGKQPNQAYLWSAQSGAMDYVLGRQALTALAATQQ